MTRLSFIQIYDTIVQQDYQYMYGANEHNVRYSFEDILFGDVSRHCQREWGSLLAELYSDKWCLAYTQLPVTSHAWVASYSNFIWLCDEWYSDHHADIMQPCLVTVHHMPFNNLWQFQTKMTSRPTLCQVVLLIAFSVNHWQIIRWFCFIVFFPL